jgi:hypothetical protein
MVALDLLSASSTALARRLRRLREILAERGADISRLRGAFSRLEAETAPRQAKAMTWVDPDA